MKISKIEITNIKGIENNDFNLDLAPNKPNILVAPNGYGKSSFAIAFASLKSSKIELDNNNYFNKKTTNRPILQLSLSNGNTLIADDTQNTIKSVFDVYVINNQTEPKSVVQTYNGYSFAKTTMEIASTVLVKTIPPKVDFNYSSAQMKSDFGTNGNRLLLNIENILNYAQLFLRIENSVDFTRFALKSYKGIIDDSIEQINLQSGTGKDIKRWIEINILPSIQTLDEYGKLTEIIGSFGFKEITDDVDLFLTAWQIIFLKNTLGANFKKACKYLYFLDEKEKCTQTISSFNPVQHRFDIKPKEESNSLVVHWPKADDISNGERDILTFIALLLKFRRDFKISNKRDCILIIDEIFDYLDDANLISFQYYISTFIDEMKRIKKRIYPVLLTHLDPLFFNHFCFNDSKIKVNYLKEVDIKSNQHILNLIYKRIDSSIQNDVDAYFFHYHPDSSTIDISGNFDLLGLNKAWGKPDQFFKKVFREVRRYLIEEDTFDPLAICFGVRVQIEKLVYDKIGSTENKRLFIEETNGTKKKLLFAQDIGVIIPETYFLLGIIYNTSLHLSVGQDVSKPLGLKLENETIKQMILNIFK